MNSRQSFTARKIRYLIFINVVILSTLIGLGQACTSAVNKSGASSFSLCQSGGNGNGYGGITGDNPCGGGQQRATFVQLQDTFTCEGQSAPKIVVRREFDNTWTQVVNETNKCGNQISPIIVTNYVEGSGLLGLNGVDLQKTPTTDLTPPTLVNNVKYIGVSASAANQSTDDADLTDGICADASGNCSLLAALQTANVTPSSVVISMKSSTYKLDRPFEFTSQFPIYILGQSATSVFIEQPARISGDRLFTVSANSNVVFHNLTIRNVQPGKPAISTTGNLVLSFVQMFGISNIAVEAVGAKTVNIRSTTIANSLGSALSLGGSPGDTACEFGCLIENSTISGNFGSGIVYSVMGNSMSINNSTIVNNGDGVTRFNIYQPSTLEDLTWALNLLGLNSFVSKPIYLNNSIVAENVYGSASADCKFDPRTTSIIANYSLFENSNCFTQQNNSIITSNLMLGALSYNNSPLIMTKIPLFGSPAIDAGSNAYCPAYDQRGLPRPQSILGGAPRCDIGAVEVGFIDFGFSSTPTPVSTLNITCPSNLTTGNSGTCSSVSSEILLSNYWLVNGVRATECDDTNSCTWNNISAGNYGVYAVARDINGFTIYSNLANISVADPVVVVAKEPAKDPAPYVDPNPPKDPAPYVEPPTKVYEEPVIYYDPPKYEEPVIYYDPPKYEEPVIYYDPPKYEEPVIYYDPPKYEEPPPK